MSIFAAATSPGKRYERFCSDRFRNGQRQAHERLLGGRGGRTRRRGDRFVLQPDPPAAQFYSRFTTAIHGLTYDDTAEAPDFETVWKQIAPRIEGLPLVAHNSPFDEGCLRAVFELYGMPYPGYRFYCTCRASRRTFGTRLPNHQLHTVSAACGFDLANHHHALADAEACARIALKIL